MNGNPETKREEASLFLPPEWAHHEATWLSWPNSGGASFDKEDLARVLPTIARFLNTLLESGETIHINVSADWEKHLIDSTISGHHRHCVRYFEIPTNEPWCRDHGPTFLSNGAGKRAAVCWKYNAWGQKYHPYSMDKSAARRMAGALDIEPITPDLVLEGGSIDSGESRSLLVSESSVVNSNRNANADKLSIERVLKQSLGAETIIWLNCEIPGDDTDGHIDCFARNAPGQRVLVPGPGGWMDSASTEVADIQRPLLENKLEVVELPTPAKKTVRGLLVPATYANYYVANNVVVVPSFNDPCDEEAARVISFCYPDRPTTQIDATELIYGQGGFHCLTQQLPT